MLIAMPDIWFHVLAFKQDDRGRGRKITIAVVGREKVSLASRLRAAGKLAMPDRDYRREKTLVIF